MFSEVNAHTPGEVDQLRFRLVIVKSAEWNVTRNFYNEGRVLQYSKLFGSVRLRGTNFAQLNSRLSSKSQGVVSEASGIVKWMCRQGMHVIFLKIHFTKIGATQVTEKLNEKSPRSSDSVTNWYSVWGLGFGYIGTF